MRKTVYCSSIKTPNAVLVFMAYCASVVERGVALFREQSIGQVVTSISNHENIPEAYLALFGRRVDPEKTPESSLYLFVLMPTGPNFAQELQLLQRFELTGRNRKQLVETFIGPAIKLFAG